MVENQSVVTNINTRFVKLKNVSIKLAPRIARGHVDNTKTNYNRINRLNFLQETQYILVLKYCVVL